jgi:uncharacterized protein
MTYVILNSVQPYLISWFKYTPTEEVRRLKIPCLLVQGETDIQVSVSDAEALRSARSECQLEVIPGMNHVMKMVPADKDKQVASYGDPSLPISAELHQVLARFFSSEPVRAPIGASR